MADVNNINDDDNIALISKVLWCYSLALNRFLTWKIKHVREKLMPLSIEESDGLKTDVLELNGEKRYTDWRLRVVSADLQDSRRLNEEKDTQLQASEKEDTKQKETIKSLETSKNEQAIELKEKNTTICDAICAANTCYEVEMKFKREASTMVETLKSRAEKAEKEAADLLFKYEQAELHKETLKDDLTSATNDLTDASGNFNTSEAANLVLNKKLQEANKALALAKDGTRLEFVMKIDKNRNYETSKLQELTEWAESLYKKFSEKDLPRNKNDEDFPFPLKEVANGDDLLVELRLEIDKIVEIKTDPILFRTFNDLIWNVISNDKGPRTYDTFLSFNGWIGTNVFDTRNAFKFTNRISNKRKRVGDTAATSTLETNKHAKTVTIQEVRKPLSPAGSASTTSTSNSSKVVVLRDLQSWSELSDGEKTHAKTLKYTQNSWDNFEIVSSCSTKQSDLNPGEKAAVDFLFEGEWPPAYAGGAGFESNFVCSKPDAKAGGFVSVGTVRYFLVRSTGGEKWDVIRMIEDKEAQAIQCPFCKSWKKIQGINMHMRSCSSNKTESNKKNTTESNKKNATESNRKKKKKSK